MPSDLACAHAMAVTTASRVPGSVARELRSVRGWFLALRVAPVCEEDAVRRFGQLSERLRPPP
jgi:hypothetical protein